MTSSLFITLAALAALTAVAALVIRSLVDLRARLADMQAQQREDSQRGRAEAAEKQSSQLVELQKQATATVTLMQRQLEEMRRSFDARMQGFTGSVTEQLAGSNKVIAEVKGQLGALGETARNIQALGQDISSLHDILAAPKLRGNLGETFLEELLRQVLPPAAYTMQYRMPGSEPGSVVVVDAVVQLGERRVPIDAKFPLESFQRVLTSSSDEERLKARKGFVEAVCKHIDVVANKYVRPEAGTYDFALMYLPAENLYYEAVIRDQPGEQSVMAHAARARVIPVSPNTLYAYLLTVAYGLKGMQIERQAETIRGQLVQFQRRFTQFYELFDKVGKHVSLAYRQHDEAARKAEALVDQVNQLSGNSLELEEPKQYSLVMAEKIDPN